MDEVFNTYITLIINYVVIQSWQLDVICGTNENMTRQTCTLVDVVSEQERIEGQSEDWGATLILQLMNQLRKKTCKYSL